MIQQIKRMCGKAVAEYQKLAVRRAEMVKIRKKRKLWQNVALSPEQEKVVKIKWGG